MTLQPCARLPVPLLLRSRLVVILHERLAAQTYSKYADWYRSTSSWLWSLHTGP